MCDRLQNCPKGGYSDGNIEQMGSEEKVVKVAKNRKSEVHQSVEEGIVRDGNSSFPYLSWMHVKLNHFFVSQLIKTIPDSASQRS